MTLTRKNHNLLNPLPGLLDEFLTRDDFDWAFHSPSNSGTTVPAVNIKETPEHFEVEVAAPGMKKEDFKIELNNNLLTIRSEKQEQYEENKEGKYNRREFSYQSFQRNFTLAKEIVDADKIVATYENGLLHLLIPKREEIKPKPSRLISIN